MRINPLLLERHGRNARTLVKEGPLRVTLVMVRAGGTIAAHHVAGPITAQVLRGDIQFRVSGREHRLVAGDLLAVPGGAEHEVTSDAGGTFLLTVVEPEPTRPDRSPG